jgi:hypothetical protein
VSPTGDAAYITLMAVGKLLKLDPRTGDRLGEVRVGPRPRGIAVSHDGKDVYVTRFISPDSGGEVVKVDAAAMTVATRIVLKVDTETEDSDQRARGVPNYLFSVALTPDGRQAWIPARRTTSCAASCGTGATSRTTRRSGRSPPSSTRRRAGDLRQPDRSRRSQPAVHVEFSPYGTSPILTLAVRTASRCATSTVPPRSSRRSATSARSRARRCSRRTGACSCRAALSRNVLVYDLSAMLETSRRRRRRCSRTSRPSRSEKLPPQILAGKKIFHNAEDTRMAFEGYMSCGGCHFEGDDDGRVYDFSTRGEGLRTRPRCSAARERAGPPQLVRHARRGAGLRASDPRALRRPRVPPDDALPRRHARSTARGRKAG